MYSFNDYDNNVSRYWERYRDINDSYVVAAQLSDEFLVAHDVLRTGFITFCGRELSDDIVIYDREGRRHEYGSYTVLCVNESVIDAKHGFKSMSVAEYIARLVVSQPLMNGAVRVDKTGMLDTLGIALIYEALKLQTDCNAIYTPGKGLSSIPMLAGYDKDILYRLIDYVDKFEGSNGEKSGALSRLTYWVSLSKNKCLYERFKAAGRAKGKKAEKVKKGKPSNTVKSVNVNVVKPTGEKVCGTRTVNPIGDRVRDTSVKPLSASAKGERNKVSEQNRIRPGMIVRHFKWELVTPEERANNKYRYRVLSCDSMHTETGERLVIYQAMYADEKGEYRVFARPYEMFMEKVDKVKNPKIQQEYRFEVDRDYAENLIQR